MSEIKKVVLYAIVPAIIAGLFALIPKIYDEMSEPKASLEYVVYKGPLLKADGLYKSIVSIEVENTGKKTLSNMSAIIEPIADVESESLNSSMGLETKKLVKGKVVKVSADKMHPRDKFTVSLMLSSETSIMSPKIALRTDEVVGTIRTDQRNSSRGLSFISGILSGFSVFIMAVIFIVKAQLGIALPSALSKQDNLFYIAAKIGNDDLVNFMNSYKGNLTYLRFSDILFYLGQHGKLRKQDAINGLECLLLVDEIAPSSRKHIERSMTVLSEYEFNSNHFEKLQEKSKGTKSSIELRNAIDRHLELAEVF